MQWCALSLCIYCVFAVVHLSGPPCIMTLPASGHYEISGALLRKQFGAAANTHMSTLAKVRNPRLCNIADNA